MKFLNVDSLEKAREKILQAVGDTFVRTESIDTREAVGRCLAEDVFCPEMIPDFYRSTVDGYAVKAKDTQGAGESIPVFLDIVEEISIGKPARHELKSGECAYVPTGGMVPDGADAMVMVEYTELFDDTSVAIYNSVSAGRNVVQIGEDAKKDSLLLKKGTILNAAAIGVLASIGRNKVQVFCPLKLTIISTGDELRTPGEKKNFAEIYDVNTYAIKALAEEQGFEILQTFVLKDDEIFLEKTLRHALTTSDIVTVSGGSSQGKKDMTADMIDKIADPGVWTHGLALKPGKPTIIGMDEPSKTLLVGLPGHPVAALMVFKLMVSWLKSSLFAEEEKMKIPAVMESNVPGAPGRATCQMVKLIQGENGYIARPVFGKSGLMSTLTQADGYVMLEINQEGLRSGETVYVELL